MPNLTFDLTGKRIWVAGETGMVGRAVLKRLESEPCEIISAPRSELDLTDQKATDDWIYEHAPDVIIMAAAKVGGIKANMDNSAGFLSENLAISRHVIDAAHEHGVEKLIYLGSSCIYPKHADQPITETSLLTGALEPTNEAYALAKIAGIKLGQYYFEQHKRKFISVMPTNLYGSYDKFDPEQSHVIPALIYKMHHAKEHNQPEVKLWGSGTPLREFLYVEDLADALIFILKHYEGSLPINIGSGEEISIRDLAKKIKHVIGYKGEIIFDTSMPDGTPRKLLDSSRLNTLGWAASTSLETGLKAAYEWYKNSV